MLTTRRIAAVCLIACGLLTLAVAVGYLAIAHPVAEDFWRAAKVQDNGWANYIFNETYNKWSGRWAGIGLQAFVLSHVDFIKLYPLLLGIIWVITLAGLWAYWRMLGLGTRWWHAPLLAILFFLMWWSGATELRPGFERDTDVLTATGSFFYWFPGAVENPLSIALAMLLLMTAGWVSARTDRWPWLIGWGVLGIIGSVVAGLHEVTGLLLVLAGIAGAIIAPRPVKWPFGWMIFIVLTAAGLVYVVAAPGNAVRAHVQGTAHLQHDLHRTLSMTLLQCKLFLTEWSLRPTLLAATVLLLLNPLRFARPQWADRLGHWRWSVPLALLAAVVGMFAVYVWTTGGIVNARMIVDLQGVFLMAWFAAIAAMMPREWREPDDRLVLAACLFLGLSLLLTGTARQTLTRNAPGVKSYYRAVQERFALTRAAVKRDDKVLTLPALPKTPAVLYDASPADSSFHTKAYGYYFGFDEKHIAIEAKE